MLRRLAPIIIISALIFFSFILATPARADINDITGDGSADKYLQDFCAKRQGNQMNLETWYSGKCTDDTFSGEGVGFSDIIILDLAEKLSGKKDPGQTFSQTILKVLENFSVSMHSTPEEKQLAIASARQEIFSNHQGGLVNGVGNMIGSLFQSQPASTYSYLAHVSNNLQKNRIIPEALAAPSPSSGTGFSTFYAFLPLWTAMRNIAYLGLVVFFVVYGFMIMFRVNLGQKTVITVQLAIPKLIVTLLIITFSYAIVGLLIDFMWVLVYFSLSLLKQQNLIFSGNVPFVGYEWYPAKVASGEQFGIFGSFFVNALVSAPAAIYGALSIIIGGGGIAANLATIGMIAVGAGISIILGIVIIIAVLIAYAKLLFKLISAFISIVISLITAPVVLLGNAFPGSNAIGNWFRGLIANISVFPITMLLLLFSYMLMVQPVFEICGGGIIDVSAACEDVFGVKDLSNDSSDMVMPLFKPLFGSFNSSGLLALLGVGLLLMASKYVDMVRDALKVPAFKYGSSIGEALKMGVNLNNDWAQSGYKNLPRGMRTSMTSNLKDKSLAAKEAVDKFGKV
ncbi:MAG TPA: hypothetical protein VLH94_01125 [Spirochaetia bacterium]|nr:hypothetical protein [Spirochaetia bacterium]